MYISIILPNFARCIFPNCNKVLDQVVLSSFLSSSISTIALMSLPIHLDQHSESLTRPRLQSLELYHDLLRHFIVYVLLWGVEHLVKIEDINVLLDGFLFRATDSDRSSCNFPRAPVSTGLFFSIMTPPRMNTLSLWSTVRTFKNLIIRPKKFPKRRVSRPLYDDPTPTTSIQTSEVPETSSTPAAPVVDLTNEIRITDPHAVAHGGFADIHRGEWVHAAGETGRVVGKTTQVCCTFFPPPPRP